MTNDQYQRFVTPVIPSFFIRHRHSFSDSAQFDGPATKMPCTAAFRMGRGSRAGPGAGSKSPDVIINRRPAPARRIFPERQRALERVQNHRRSNHCCTSRTCRTRCRCRIRRTGRSRSGHSRPSQVRRSSTQPRKRSSVRRSRPESVGHNTWVGLASSAELSAARHIAASSERPSAPSWAQRSQPEHMPERKEARTAAGMSPPPTGPRTWEPVHIPAPGRKPRPGG